MTQLKIEELWKTLESEASTGSKHGVLLRRALPESGFPVHVGIEVRTMKRLILLPLNGFKLPPRADWPDCLGLELVPMKVLSETDMAVGLKDADAADVFTVLTEDVARRVVAAKDGEEAIAVLFDRLHRWQFLLTIVREGMGPERQRGLWGELHVLTSHVIPSVGAAAAVTSWNAPKGSHQDFQVPSCAIEVKTTAAKQPQAVRIASERQLDSTGTKSLYLWVVIVDERDIPPPPSTDDDSSSLGGMIRSIREVLKGDVATLATFNARVEDYGWLDSQSQRYEHRQWTVRGDKVFRVGPGFPRIVESELPDGIGDVSYSLSLASCANYDATPTDVAHDLKGAQ